MAREALEFQKKSFYKQVSVGHEFWYKKTAVVVGWDWRSSEQLSLEADTEYRSRVGKDRSIGNKTGRVKISLKIVQTAAISSYG